MNKLTDFEELGKRWLRNEVLVEAFDNADGDTITLNGKQAAQINDKHRFSMALGGMASGKTLGWQAKLLNFSQWFPGTRMLVGRRTLKNAESTFMKDWIDICPPGLYQHKIGDHKLVFQNGTEVVFFGLDALQSGSGDDLKKAIQELKSHNFGFIFIDQFEEIQHKVYDSLNSRMRRRQCKHPQSVQTIYYDEEKQPFWEECQICGKASFNQMNFTMNPVYHWSINHFVRDPQPMTWYVQTATEDNKENLSAAFLASEKNKSDSYVQKNFYGKLDIESLMEGRVFAHDYIKHQRELHTKPKLRSVGDLDIFVNPDRSHEYQIGIDPSEGSVDPCSIQVVDKTTGEQVASFSQYVPLYVIASKALDLAEMYAGKRKPLIVCEVQGGGQAVIEKLKEAGYTRLYEREVYLGRERKKKTKKIGFHTNSKTKPMLITNLTELMDKQFPKIADERIIMQMEIFQYRDDLASKGATAPEGEHDDHVMAIMLAYLDLKPVDRKEQSIIDRVLSRQKPKGKVQYIYN